MNNVLNNLIVIALAVLCLLNIEPSMADDKTGQRLYQQCASCHGAQAQGNAELKAPALAGQATGYLYEQLKAFKNGSRGAHPQDIQGQVMASQLNHLELDQLQRISDFLTAQPKAIPERSASLASDMEVGKDLYIRDCAACHGFNAEGVPQFKSPNLKLLSKTHLVEQFESYKKSWRGGGQNATTVSRWMNVAANQIQDRAQVEQIASYIASLNDLEP